MAPKLHSLDPLDSNSAQWNHPITHSDYTKMLKGFVPRDMDDKWMIVTDQPKPDAEGNTILHACRSWTSTEQWRLEVQAGKLDDTNDKGTDGADGAAAGAWGKIVSITWRKTETSYETGEPIGEEEMKETAIGFCKGLLGCEFKK